MDIYPAIDLKDGKAVRLTKGIMDSAKIYSDEPWKLASSFEKMGSSWLHLVDLNGAFSGKPENLAQIKKIIQNLNLKTQIGGGIRDEENIKMYIDLGISRVILGSIAVSDPDFVKEMASKYPVAIGIDAIDGMVAVSGWATKSKIKAIELAKIYKNSDIKAIICTDVSKDGTLSGVNVDFTTSIKKHSEKETIASGGVKDINDIKVLLNTKTVDGAIIGKAFYEGKLDIKEALKLI